MLLESGQRVGSYEIVSAVGEGGMGEVYRARDVRLDRTVAIKTIKGHFTDRFEREARAISSLNHPNICTLHDIGEHESAAYLVMEYVDGKPLAGPLSLADTLRYAIQIGEALDAAHRAGIVHRDLKPGNILVTKAGVKLLDFGLAKANAMEASAAGPATLALTQALTGEGTILGTPQYMAPEQIESGSADARSDIFAFGCVLYEMITGRQAFQGKSAASVMAAVLHSDPAPVSTISPVTPRALDRIVSGCMAKDPADRWQSIHDVVLQLRALAEQGPETAAAGMVTKPSRWPWWIAGLALVAAGVFGLWFSRRPPAPLGPVVQFTVSVPDAIAITWGGVAVSPDGKWLVIGARTKDRRGLWLRSLDRDTISLIPGTESAQQPFWSPDSRSVAFFTPTHLVRADLNGAVQNICAAGTGRGGSWSSDGTIIFGSGVSRGLMRVSAAGGNPSPVTQLDIAQGESLHELPQFLSDGKRFLYTIRSAKPERAGTHLAGPDGKSVRRVLDTPYQVHYVSVEGKGSFLVFSRERLLHLQRVDPDSLSPAGEPLVLSDRAELGARNRVTTASLSRGVLAYRRADALLGGSFQIYGRSGKPVFGPYHGLSGHAEFSPDGKRVVLDMNQAPNTINISVLDIQRSLISRFTFDGPIDWTPIWSPDGAYIYFTSSRGNPDGHYDIWRKASNGSGQDELVYRSPQYKHHMDISADGTLLMFESRTLTGYDLHYLRLNDLKQGETPYLASPYEEGHPQFSPDGKWVAYISNESGILQVYVQSFPPGRGKWQISNTGGVQPRWRADFKELTYLSADGNLVSVPIHAGAGGVQLGTPVNLFDTGTPGTFATAHYDMTSDGSQFLTLSSAATVPQPTNVIVNWTALIK